MQREWYNQGSEWLFHSRRYFLSKLHQHLYRGSSSSDKTHKAFKLKYSKVVPMWTLYIILFVRGFSIMWPWNKIALCATRGVESCELWSLPIKFLLTCIFVWGNAGRPQIASLAFGGEVLVKG
jgi:hypothetical protein